MQKNMKETGIGTADMTVVPASCRNIACGLSAEEVREDKEAWLLKVLDNAKNQKQHTLKKRKE